MTGDSMSSAAPDWRPSASRERLQQRAAMFARLRAFFAALGVLEVDTPQLINFAVTDPHLHSAEVRWPATSAHQHSMPSRARLPPRYLHTSPEYAMKRLLASGSGDIYQLCHVFRGDEHGAVHNGEFSLLEWYRVGASMQTLMAELDALLRLLMAGTHLGATRYLRYEQTFIDALDYNPLHDSEAKLRSCAGAHGVDVNLVRECSRDALLDLLMAARIGPQLGLEGPTFVHHYPASQAALARLDPSDSRVALRFELYLHGVELANGFEELAAAQEQRARFQADQRQRVILGLTVPAIDEYLMAALQAGLPACAGVAVGLDRVLMLASGAARIADVLPFTSEHA